MANEFEVVVIGSGPGGYVAAIRAAQLGLKTAIVEKESLGGVCLNIGCIPSKALLKNAEYAYVLQHQAKEFGFSFKDLELDYAVAFKRSRQVSDRLVKGVGFLMKKNNIEVFEGSGRVSGPQAVQVALNEGDTIELAAQNIIIATGSHPKQVPGVTIDGQKIVTYIEAIMADSRPERAVIIGGGAIGVEFAYVWANYGTEVTSVEFLPRLLPREDPECAEVLEKASRKLGIKVITGHAVEKVEPAGEALKVTVNDGSVIECDQVMVAVGFGSNVAGLGLEEVGVTLDEQGAIAIDEHMRTSVPSIYAIGDCATEHRLAHIASAMGIVAAETIAGHPTTALDYRMLPRATYGQPQVASFGYTEEEAREAGYEINVGRFPFQPNGRALGMSKREGFVKIIADARYGEILGAHMVGPDVSELLAELTLAQQAELTAEEIARNVHAHPTLSEVVMEAAHGVEGSPIHM